MKATKFFRIHRILQSFERNTLVLYYADLLNRLKKSSFDKKEIEKMPKDKLITEILNTLHELDDKGIKEYEIMLKSRNTKTIMRSLAGGDKLVEPSSLQFQNTYSDYLNGGKKGDDTQK